MTDILENARVAAMPELLTPQEAAERLRVTDKTIIRWCRTGRLRSVALPSGRFRIPADALDEFTVAEPTEASA